MGLLSTEVEVILNAQTTKYYENLGYTIPRYFSEFSHKYVVKNGTTLLVDIQDLPKGSHALVDLICDGCGKKMKRTYYDYNKRNYDGKVYCFHCAHKILNSGENNCNWNPKLTDEERLKVRKYPEYTQFIKSVLARDNYTCQCCGKNNTNDMDVHHLYAYSSFPQYRVDQTQAITLCKQCHIAFHSWYIENFGYTNKGKCTRDDYEKWIGYTLNELSDYNGELTTARKIYDYETGIIYNNTNECANILNMHLSSVYRCCNHTKSSNYKNQYDENIQKSKALNYAVKGHHLFWLDEYNLLTKEEIQQYINPIKNSKPNILKNTLKKKSKSRYRKIVCIVTGEIFEKIKDAGEKYRLKNPYKITENCKGLSKSAGKLPDGTRLKWMFYEDFLKLTENEQNEILTRNKNY